MTVNGKDINLYVYRDIAGVPTPVLAVCGTSCTLSFSSEEIILASKTTGRHRVKRGGFIDGSVSLEGLVTLDEITSWQYDDFEENIGEELHVLLTFENSLGDRMAYDMNVLIQQVESTGDAADFGRFSVSASISGTWTKAKIFNAVQDANGDYILDDKGNLIR